MKSNLLQLMRHFSRTKELTYKVWTYIIRDGDSFGRMGGEWAIILSIVSRCWANIDYENTMYALSDILHIILMEMLGDLPTLGF